MKDDNEIILTIGNTDFKISKDSIQVRANQETALVEKGFKIKRGKKTVELLGGSFTTTLASWVDVTGLPLTKKQKSFLKELQAFVIEHKLDWYQIASIILQFFKH